MDIRILAYDCARWQQLAEERTFVVCSGEVWTFDVYKRGKI
jgi:hypothetical protein